MMDKYVHLVILTVFMTIRNGKILNYFFPMMLLQQEQDQLNLVCRKK